MLRRLLAGHSGASSRLGRCAPHPVRHRYLRFPARQYHGLDSGPAGLAQESGLFEVVNTEDVSLLNAGYLRDFDAVYFFTSGELPLSDKQKTDLVDFVRQGKGFGGSHSATDTLYTWPEYGDMIGGYFDGHPWTQEASVDVEDPGNVMVKHMSPSFRALEESINFGASPAIMCAFC